MRYNHVFNIRKNLKQTRTSTTQYHIPTDINTAIYVFNLYMQLTLGQYYKIELLSNHCSCLYGNGGRRYIGLVPNKDVIIFSQERVTKCNNFH